MTVRVEDILTSTNPEVGHRPMVKDGDLTTLPHLTIITQQGEFADSVNTIRFKIFLFDKHVRLKEIDIQKKSNIHSQGKPYQILTE